MQGWLENGRPYMFLQQWEPHTDDWLIWEHSADSMSKCADAFLDAPIFDGRKFWDVEKEIEWIDA